MVRDNGVLRIFWPLDTVRTTRSGVIVGWRNSPSDLFVVTVLVDVEPRSVDNALRVGHLFRNSSHPMSRMFDLCGHSSMSVLGTTNGPEFATINQWGLHVRLDPQVKYPTLVTPTDFGTCVQMILYQKPSPSKMQYMSLSPIALALGDKDRVDYYDAEGTRLFEKMRLHTVIHHMPTPKELIIPKIIGQINCSEELTELMLKNVHLIGVRQKRRLSVSERVVESASTAWGFILSTLWSVWTIWIFPVVTRIFISGLICHRFIAEIILRVLEWRPGSESTALTDISATAQQVDIRLQQFCYWPIQYTTLRRKKDDWNSVTDNHPDYIRFYNSLWLVANDIIIGIALGSFIIDNADWVASFLNKILSEWTVSGLKGVIEWLTEWPAGLKLNTELASFLADLVLWVVEYWSCMSIEQIAAMILILFADLLNGIKPLLPHVIYFVGFSSFAGATLPIALFTDLVDLLTIHIYAFYVASARIYHWQLTIITSLFHLFRGKKNNILRKRIDSCDYDLDQLLLGTILFTLLVFLLPTVVVFYLTFALSRMAIISLTAILETVLACLNHFPLFALMLRLKDSKRLPGGICFELQAIGLGQSRPQCLDNAPPTSFVTLKSIPLPLREMFDQYFQVGSRLRRHYLSPSVLLCLLTGQFVPPIHRRNLYSLQYSMLPARRADIGEVWRRLNEERPVSRKTLVNGVVRVPNGFHATSRRAGHRYERQSNLSL